MYEKLTDFASIYQAYKKTAKGKHDKNEVVRYETNLHMQLWRLKERIENKKYIVWSGKAGHASNLNT